MKNKKTLFIVIAAAIVLVGIMLLLIFLPKGGKKDEESASVDEAQVSLSTDSKGVHQAAVQRNSNGEVEQNGSGKLIEYFPAQISQIHLENKKGTVDVLSNTPEGEATVYTVKGYENFDLQGGIPDQIASAAAAVSFSQVAGKDDGKNSADYGFDSPRAVATVTYTDKSKAVITVGNDAPQEAGTYVKFGDGDDIYLVDAETMAAFDYGLTDLISLTINDAASDTETSQPKSVEINGANFSETIELVPNNSEKVSASYKMTAPVECYANEKESSLITGGIRGLFADSVVYVNPSESQLASAGLSEPYAHIKAEYSDAVIELIASKPDSDGNIKLMVSGGNVVYTINAEKAAWVETSYEKLVSEYALNPKMTALSNMTVTYGGKDYSFDLSSKTVLTTDDQGSETESTTTVVYYNGNEIQTEKFSPLFDDAGLIELADAKTETPSGNFEMKITYTYSDDSSTDTLEFYPSADSRYLAVLNGRAEGHSRKSDITRVVGALNDILN